MTSSSDGWSPLIPNLAEADPSSLLTSTPFQLAKDVDYATAVQKAWKEEMTERSSTSESKSYVYKDAATDDALLYGHLVRSNANNKEKVPGILFFHTGAGPHDIFLHWKADSLVTNQHVFPNGCVVLLADILSDESGWGWSSDRTRYNQARTRVLSANAGDGIRVNLRKRLQAALDALGSIPEVDSDRLAGLGWCLGGHSILELGRMGPQTNMRAMATFHGVFDNVPPPSQDDKQTVESPCQVLICNGAEDPFVPKQAVANGVASLTQCGCTVQVLNMEGAKHGFTNPAQDFNPNPSFAFNSEAATSSWTATLELLKSTLS